VCVQEGRNINNSYSAREMDMHSTLQRLAGSESYCRAQRRSSSERTLSAPASVQFPRTRPFEAEFTPYTDNDTNIPIHLRQQTTTPCCCSRKNIQHPFITERDHSFPKSPTHIMTSFSFNRGVCLSLVALVLAYGAAASAVRNLPGAAPQRDAAELAAPSLVARQGDCAPQPCVCSQSNGVTQSHHRQRRASFCKVVSSR